MDPPMFVWNAWNFQSSLLNPPYNPFIAHDLLFPFKPNTVMHTYTPFRNFTVLLLSNIMGRVTAFNIVTLLMYTFSAFGAYLLTTLFTKKCFSAFISGIIFSFCSYKLGRLSGHYNLIDTAFIPFYILSLYKLKEEKSRFIAITAGLQLALTGYCCYYYLVFAFIFTILFFAYYYLPESQPSFIRKNYITRKKVSMKTKKGLKNITLLIGIPAVFVAFYVIIIGPITHPPFSARSASRAVLILLILYLLNIFFRYRLNLRALFKSLVNTLQKLHREKIILGFLLIGAAFIFFFTPILLNLFKEINEYPSEIERVKDYPSIFDYISLKGRGLVTINKYIFNITGNNIERRVYLGIIPLALGVYAYFKLKKSRDVRFWFFTGLTFFILSLGPSFKIFERGLLWLPYNIIQSIPLLRGAREPSRYIIITMLSLGILTAYSINYIYTRLKLFKKLKKILPAAAAVLIFSISVDYISIPNDMINLSVPSFYRTIGKDPEKYSILEIPFKIQGKGREIGGATYRYGLYQYYQSVHKKRLLSGYLAYVPYKIFDYYHSIRFIKNITLLQDEKNGIDSKRKIWKEPYSDEPELLIDLYKVHYIILHKKDLDKYSVYYLDKYLKKQLGRIQKIINDNDLRVYELQSPKESPFENKNLIEKKYEITLFEGWSKYIHKGNSSGRFPLGKKALLAFPIDNEKGYRLKFDITLFLKNREYEQTLKISVNNKLTAIRLIKPFRLLNDRPESHYVSIPPNFIIKGTNIFSFEFDPAPTRDDLFLINGIYVCPL